ncbi:semaphorin-5A-like [Mytilus californianus]|uniref:semaphorin-5A-like n=1 Tax=Mytilus californianus TaxID=6549 RepID=UPI002248739B|nr:semaphorin-5A-like [Mytilus californianus]XP_052089328.1 semaphorin-5A-like [Mytilus californianus]
MYTNPFICCLIIDFKEWASNQTLYYEGTCTDSKTTIDIHNFNETTCIIPGWSPWINSSCSATCGDGVIIKTRTCDNPPPSDDGLKCVGSEIETSLCNLRKCRASCRRSKKRSVDHLDNKSGSNSLN